MSANKVIRTESFQEREWIYGYDVFENGAIIPWVRLAADYNPGMEREWCKKTNSWKFFNSMMNKKYGVPGANGKYV